MKNCWKIRTISLNSLKIVSPNLTCLSLSNWEALPPTKLLLSSMSSFSQSNLNPILAKCSSTKFSMQSSSIWQTIRLHFSRRKRQQRKVHRTNNFKQNSLTRLDQIKVMWRTISSSERPFFCRREKNLTWKWTWSRQAYWWYIRMTMRLTSPSLSLY